MSTGVFQRIGKDTFQKLRVYRDFGGASVKNIAVGPCLEKKPIHQAVQAAVTQVEFLESDSLSGTPLNTKFNNSTRDTDPYLARYISDLNRTYFEVKK